VGELRVDPLSGLRVVFAPERTERPGAFPAVPPSPHIDPAGDPFAPGHEDRTPPERGRVAGADGGWSARAFENRYPALAPDAEDPPREASLDLFTSAGARGHHEVIVNTPRPLATLGALTPEELAAAMGLWRERMAAHAGARHVHLHVNEGACGGASQAHSHAQLWALDFVPAAVARERERCTAYATRTQGSDLLGDLVQAEVRLRERLVGYDDEAVLLAPYASRVPFQLMVAPRTPVPRFEAPGVLGAALLHRALRALEAHLGGPPPLTLWVRTAPRGAEHFCWRIDVLPRLFAAGGLELGTGVHLNPVLPERAAAELRPLLARPELSLASDDPLELH